MFTKKSHIVHIELKDHVFRFVESLQPNLQGIKSFGERYLPPGVIREGKIIERETLSMIMDEVIGEYRLRGRKVHFFVPDAFVVVRKITIEQAISDDEILGYLYMEIGGTIHLPFDDAQFDYAIINKRKDSTEIALVASPKATIEEYKSLLEELKLKPVVADLSSLSIYRLLERIEIMNAQEHVMVIQFDIRAVNVTIFHEQIPQFTRHLKLNLDHELWEFSKGRGRQETVSWIGDPGELDGQVQEMIMELERMMNFYRFSVTNGRAGISKILLTGDFPQMEQILNRIKGAVEVPVEQINGSLVSTRSGKDIPERYHGLVGLSLKREVRK